MSTIIDRYDGPSTMPRMTGGRVCRPAPAPPAVAPCSGEAVRRTRPAPGAVRLTRRGRRAVVLLVLTGLTAAGLLLADPAISGGRARQTHVVTVVVQPGQTLWDIARRFDPQQDPRAAVDELMSYNGIRDAGDIRVGEPVRVPVG
ncbi:MAG TPA: LysM domain-containing protein [Nocardioidaceae bacterium]|nr:LysM domain-containing protein [Nocardioidaceae bacterium]